MSAHPRFRMWTPEELAPRTLHIARQVARRGKNEIAYQQARAIIELYESLAKGVSARAVRLNRELSEKEHAVSEEFRQSREEVSGRLAEEERQHAIRLGKLREELSRIDGEAHNRAVSETTEMVRKGLDELSEYLDAESVSHHEQILALEPNDGQAESPERKLTHPILTQVRWHFLV